MNELTKIKHKILARIENYIVDMEKAEELTFDEKIILSSVKEIINEEFGTATLDTLPRFIIHENGKMEQIKTSEEKGPTYYDMFRFKKMLVKEDREKFQKFLDEHERLRAKEEQNIEYVVKFFEFINKISHNCEITYESAKKIIIDLMIELETAEEEAKKRKKEQ